MIQRIVLIRHGQTEKDKTNPNRKLTEIGRNQIIETCKIISKKVPGIRKNLEIFSSNTNRTIESAMLIRQFFGLKSITKFSNMRVLNIDSWITNSACERDVTARYFDSYLSYNLPNEVSTPKFVAESFLENLNKVRNQTKNVIIIGHGSALESFAFFQTRYKPSTRFVKELDYGDWLLLRKKVK